MPGSKYKHFVRNKLLHRRVVSLGLVIVLVASIIVARPAHAAIQVVGSSSAENGSGANSITINTPSGAAVGDVLVLTLAWKGTTVDATNISSWTCLHQALSADATVKVATCYRVLSSAPPASYTFNFEFFNITRGPYSAKAAAGMTAFSGVDTVSPINTNAQSINTSSETMTAPSVTTTVTDALVYTGYGAGVSATAMPQAGMTELFDVTSSGGGPGGSKVIAAGQYYFKSTTGPTGTKTMVATAAAENIGHTIALTPKTEVKQSAYRWFANADSTTPGAALVAQNTPATAPSNGQVRLQALMEPTTGSIVSAKNYKLQYSQKSGVCDVSFSGEAFQDIGPLRTNLINASSGGNSTDGSGQVSWTNPQNALTNDGVRANVSGIVTNGQQSSSNLSLSGYSFSLPAGAILTGIEAEINANHSDGLVSDIKMFDNSTQVGSKTSVKFASTATTKIIGGPSDLWGSNLTAADLNAGDLQLSLKIYQELYVNFWNAQIDYMSVRAYYTMPDGMTYYDNGSVSDGATAVNGGVTSSNPIVLGTYNEANPFASRVAANVSQGQDGLWDFSLDTSSLSPGSYCFRVVKESGDVLETYAQIPELTVPPPTYSQSSYRLYENADNPTPGAPLVAQNTAATIAPETPFRLRQTLRVSDSASASQLSLKLQYGTKTAACSEVAYRDLAVSGEAQGRYPSSISSPAAMGAIWDYMDDSLDEIDGNYASVWLDEVDTYSRALRVEDFAIDVPAEATIQGIEVHINGVDSVFGTIDPMTITQIHLTRNGVLEPGYKQGLILEYGDNVYGGSVDLWGGSWMVNDLNSLGIQFAIEGVAGGRSGDSLLIDAVELKIHYTVPGGDFVYHDNASVADSNSLQYTAEDPTDSGREVVPQHYAESDPLQRLNKIRAGQSGMWDLALKPGVSANGTYCFRIVKSDGTLLNNYLQYPEITVGSGPTLEQRLRGGQSVIDGVKSPLGWD